jgi:hypothetical protein
VICAPAQTGAGVRCDNVPHRAALPDTRACVHKHGMKSLWVLALLAPLAACGSSAPVCNPDPTFSGPPLMTGLKSTSGNLNLNVSSDPDTSPLVRNCFAFQYVITDSSGQPVDGLTLSVEPWMVQMSHGSSLTPVVTPMGNGVYQLTSVYLYMEGEWQLQTTISGSADTFTPTVQVN